MLYEIATKILKEVLKEHQIWMPDVWNSSTISLQVWGPGLWLISIYLQGLRLLLLKQVSHDEFWTTSGNEVGLLIKSSPAGETTLVFSPSTDSVNIVPIIDMGESKPHSERSVLSQTFNSKTTEISPITLHFPDSKLGHKIYHLWLFHFLLKKENPL